MARTLRKRDARSRAEAFAGPNMTPMVDVILVILIFFMATTVIVGEEWFLGAGVSLPAAAAGAARPERTDPFQTPAPRFVLHMRRGADGRTVISGIGDDIAGAATMDDWVRAALGGLDNESLVILIDPEPDVPYEDVVALHDALTRAGVGRIALAGAAGALP
ncbi:MAG: ExbD/TolR family protein [Phycisphaerales bacterium JB039]